MHLYLKRKQLNFLSVPIIGNGENAKNYFDILPNKLKIKGKIMVWVLLFLQIRVLNIEKLFIS